jgi:hypothetical protein
VRIERETNGGVGLSPVLADRVRAEKLRIGGRSLGLTLGGQASGQDRLGKGNPRLSSDGALWKFAGIQALLLGEENVFGDQPEIKQREVT